MTSHRHNATRAAAVDGVDGIDKLDIESAAASAAVGDRTAGWVLLVAGLVGFAAAFVLAVEKYWLLTNPFYTPSCTWGWTGFRSRPEVPATGLTGIGFVVAVGTGLTASILSWAGLVPTLQSGGTARIVLGVVLGGAGLILGLSARGTLSRHRPASESLQPVPFVTAGWFALVRNPLFTALILTQAGATIIAISWLSVLALVVLIATCEWQARSVEEPYLVRAHGQAYLTFALGQAPHEGRIAARMFVLCNRKERFARPRLVCFASLGRCCRPRACRRRGADVSCGLFSAPSL